MKCKGCIHRKTLSGVPGGNKACHYCIDTGEPRGCTAEDCYTNRIHYTTRRHLSEAQKKAKIGGMAKVRAGA